MTDLKKSAAARRTDSVESQAKAAANVEHLQPQLRRLHEFLRNLAEQLNVVNPPISHDYDLLGYEVLKDARQTRYVARAERQHQLITKVVFEFVCKGNAPIQFFVDTREECNSAKDRLNAHGLQLRWKDDADWRFVFTVHPEVLVSFAFEGYASDRSIKLKCQNFQRLGPTTYSFASEKLTNALLEEFGKRIVNQPNSFEEMSGYRVSSSIRKQFREAIAARTQEREQELSDHRGSVEQKTESPPIVLPGCLEKGIATEQRLQNRRRRDPSRPRCLSPRRGRPRGCPSKRHQHCCPPRLLLTRQLNGRLVISRNIPGW